MRFGVNPVNTLFDVMKFIAELKKEGYAEDSYYMVEALKIKETMERAIAMDAREAKAEREATGNENGGTVKKTTLAVKQNNKGTALSQ